MSTGGYSPAIASRVRDSIIRHVPRNALEALENTKSIRDKLRATDPDFLSSPRAEEFDHLCQKMSLRDLAHVTIDRIYDLTNPVKETDSAIAISPLTSSPFSVSPTTSNLNNATTSFLTQVSGVFGYPVRVAVGVAYRVLRVSYTTTSTETVYAQAVPSGIYENDNGTWSRRATNIDTEAPTNKKGYKNALKYVPGFIRKPASTGIDVVATTFYKGVDISKSIADKTLELTPAFVKAPGKRMVGFLLG